jgi:hypothetical protein
MKKKFLTKIIVLASLTLTTLTLANAQSDSRARNVVVNLYRDAKTKNIAKWGKVELKKYFDDELAEAIYKVTHSENGIDFDVLYYAQDTQIKSFRIGEAELQSPSLATVEVSFSNFGKKEEIQFLMASYGKMGWKITEVYYADGMLTKILSAD